MSYARGLIDWYITEGSIGQEKYDEFVETVLVRRLVSIPVSRITIALLDLSDILESSSRSYPS